MLIYMKGNLMIDVNTKIEPKERQCKTCGRILPIDQFSKAYGRNRIWTCKECMGKKILEGRGRKFWNQILQSGMDDSMKIQRKYKQIDENRRLDEKESGISAIANDEVFARLLYYKEAWISNYGRLIEKDKDRYRLLRGRYDDVTCEKIYTLKKEVYVKSTKKYKYEKCSVSATKLVVENFIVNYDMTNNTKIWHLNGDVKDNYYKHIYPVTEKQYNEICRRSSAPHVVEEEEIMEIVNSIKWKQDGWNPFNYQRGMFGVGYKGCEKRDLYSKCYIKWQNMLQRCYDENVHKKWKPEYKDKTVCEEWLNFANFKIWYDEHCIYGNQIDLDKDILVKGNKEYSPENCVLVEHYINTLFEKNIGYYISKKEDGYAIAGTKKDFRVKTYEEAYKLASEKLEQKKIRILENGKEKLPTCLYEAIERWDMREVG